MDIFWFIIFLVLFIYFISMILRFSFHDFPDKSQYIESYELNTGDIVGVAYNNQAGAFVGSFTNSPWVHTATIWVDPETSIRYVLEGAIYNQKKYKNFHIIPFASWINVNRYNLIGFNKYHGPPIDHTKMRECFKEIENDLKLEGFNYTWYKFLLDREYTDLIDKNYRYTCFEMTIFLGQQCGIYDKYKHFSSFFPCDVMNNNIKCCEGVYYDKTIRIVQNPNEAKLLANDRKLFPDFWKN